MRKKRIALRRKKRTATTRTTWTTRKKRKAANGHEVEGRPCRPRLDWKAAVLC